MTATAPRAYLAAALHALVARDPHGYALRRAIRAGVGVPAAFAIGHSTGNPGTATFAAFGSFSLLLFVDFPGNRTSRLKAYALLGLVGAVLIIVGTLVAEPDWLAIVSMLIVVFLVLFAGVISSIVAVSGRAALLAFILPVMLPGVPSDYPARLLGWAIAFGVCVPIVVFAWPEEDQNTLRARAAAMCQALAAMLRPGPIDPDATHPRVTVIRSIRELRDAFRASAARPVALSTGSRMLMRLVDELEWLTTTVLNACADTPGSWPKQGRRLRTAAADVLVDCGSALAHDGSGVDRACRDRLDSGYDALVAARRAVSAETLAELQSSTRVTSSTDGATPATPVPRGEFDRPLYAAHELGYVVGLAATTVAVIAAADSRSWLARLVGRAPVADIDSGEAVAAERIAVSHLDRHSVWLQNSIRGAVGLAAAVLIARVSGQHEGFWIVLGALSVLRSNALSTGATAVRAVLGTVAGFVVGGLLVAGIGTSSPVLWSVLPFAVFVAAFAPEAISFIAGQAAFTVAIIILFNIVAPSGWRIGVVRVEDVALGCAASLTAGLLFWPRGAGAVLGAALADAYRAGSEYLRQSIDYVTGRRAVIPDAGADAEASSWRLDDALRQYLAERGAKNTPLGDVTMLANGANRLRLAGTAVFRLTTTIPGGEDSTDLAAPVGQLIGRTADVASWYRTLGGVLTGSNEPLPAADASLPGDSFLDVILPAVDGCGDPGRAARAERLLWSGQYLGDVNRMRADLVEPAAAARTAQSRPWWNR